VVEQLVWGPLNSRRPALPTRTETVVVHDVLAATARPGNILLPVTTTLERDDLGLRAP
jgi:hypothetical protein